MPKHLGPSSRPGEEILEGPFARDGGRCVTAPIPALLLARGAIDSWDAPGWEVRENGIPLGTVTQNHDEIRRFGRGRYCFWGDRIYFSALDDTLPGENGRCYSVGRSAPPRAEAEPCPTRQDGFGLDPGAVPGMIVQSESDLLTAVARSTDLRSGRIVEIGPFFGRSTVALLRGVEQNPTFERTSGFRPITSIDRFAWPVTDTYAVGDVEEFVRSFARQDNLEGLISVEDGAVRFQAVFDYFTARTRLVDVVASDFRTMPPIDFSVGVLFLDGPKTSSELLAVLDLVSEGLVPGASVLFQDFFVHTSGELIGAIGALIENRVVVPVDAVASTLVCEWRGGDWRSSWPANREALLAKISVARRQVEPVAVANDPTRFMARLILAEAQVAIAGGDPKHAAEVLSNLRDRYGVRAETWSDVVDLVRAEFRSSNPAPPATADLRALRRT